VIMMLHSTVFWCRLGVTFTSGSKQRTGQGLGGKRGESAAEILFVAPRKRNLGTEAKCAPCAGESYLVWRLYAKGTGVECL